jgi:predicted GH43/DUF377 family glycosyl hydrolase
MRDHKSTHFGAGLGCRARFVALILLGGAGGFILFDYARESAAPSGSVAVVVDQAAKFEDGRPAAHYRIDAKDQGVVLRHGTEGAEWDKYGARDAWVFKEGDTYYLHYDAAGPKGWLTSLATSNDLKSFTKKGPLLELGRAEALDSASVSYGTTYFDGKSYWMNYLGTQTVSPAPDLVPSGPYYTMKAKSASPGGPWIKESGVALAPEPNTYYDLTASPGYVVKHENRYLQFFSAGKKREIGVARTIGIARAAQPNGPWVIEPDPILPLNEQIENASLYYQASDNTWFMFVNHVALYDHQESTDAIWVYWTHDIEKWNADHRAIVLDSSNSSWSKLVVGLPSILPANGKLAIFYDGLDPRTERVNGVGEHPDAYRHMLRDIGLAWLDLPIKTPSDAR